VPQELSPVLTGTSVARFVTTSREISDRVFRGPTEPPTRFLTVGGAHPRDAGARILAPCRCLRPLPVSQFEFVAWTADGPPRHSRFVAPREGIPDIPRPKDRNNRRCYNGPELGTRKSVANAVNWRPNEGKRGALWTIKKKFRNPGKQSIVFPNLLRGLPPARCLFQHH
jgi:hypothetical protein